RGLEAAVGHDQLEMLNQTFDAAVDLIFRGQNIFAFGADVYWAGGNVVDQLADDGEALLHFFQADEVSRVDVAGGHDGDFEIHGRRPLPVPIVGETEI